MAGSSAADTHSSLLAGRLPILRQSDRLECELILIMTSECLIKGYWAVLTCPQDLLIINPSKFVFTCAYYNVYNNNYYTGNSHSFVEFHKSTTTYHHL